MSISDKLIYLSDTKELIRQSLIRGGESIAPTDTFRSYVAAADRVVEKIGTGSGGGAVEPTLGFLATQWDVTGRITRGRWYGGGAIPNFYFTGGNSAGYNALTAVDGLETVTSFGTACFHQLPALLKVVAPAVTTMGNNTFLQSGALQSADFTALTVLPDAAFNGCSAFKTLILRKSSITTLAAPGALTGTLVASGTGNVYVPSALVDTYKQAANWTTYAARIVAIEDYPEITGG